MSLVVNGTTIENVNVNGGGIERVIANGVTVWEAWKYTTGDINSGVQQQGETGLTIMRGKKPVKVRTRWWWAGSSGSPTGYTKFTFHYTDGTTLTYSTGSTYRDTDADYTLPSEYQKELDTFDWELITTVGAGVVRTETQNYPKFIAWYQK